MSFTITKPRATKRRQVPLLSAFIIVFLSVSTLANEQPTRDHGKTQAEKDMERLTSHVKNEVSFHKRRFKQRRKQLEQDLEDIRRDIESHSKKLERRVKDDIIRSTGQRTGIHGFIHSVRNHIGMVLGGTVAFLGGRGGLRGAAGLQTGQIMWGVLHRFNITRGVYEPWLKDAAATAVATSVALHAYQVPALQNYLPALTLGSSMIHSTNLILDQLDEGNVTRTTRAVSGIAAAGMGIASLTYTGIPLPLAAASIAGTALLYDSIIAEVVGNWFQMLERLGYIIGREKLFELINIKEHIYYLIQKQFLPVKEKMKEIEAALNGSEIVESVPGLKERTKHAISKSSRVRFVYRVATAGVAVQLIVAHSSDLKKAGASILDTIVKWRKARHNNGK